MPGINWAGHLGGFLGGVLLGVIVARAPFRATRPATWEWLLIVALLAATAAFGLYAIGRIPLAFANLDG
jgi:CDP-diglyceride synthetase